MRAGDPSWCLIRRRTCAAIAALLGAGPPVAIAQGESAEPEQRVIVTGSQIPRIDAETALPLQIVTREEIARSGVQDIDALMARISANFGGATVAGGIGDSIHPGLSGASMRGLGDKYTLVLLDGRRVANHAFSDESGVGVDLNSIPLAAIERVEVLRDGASAIYGSDAIAGVVNFILRSDFSGAEGDITRAWAQAGGGGAERGETVAAGRGVLARDGYNLLAVIDHRRQQALPAPSRWFSDRSLRPDIGLNMLSSNSFPANVVLPDGQSVSPAWPACSPATIPRGNACKFDPDSQVQMLPRTESLGLLVRASAALPGGDRLRAEFLWNQARQRYQAAATPISRGTLPGGPDIVIPTTSPFYPQGLGLTGDVIDLRYRTLLLGPRIQDNRADAQRLLAGWQGGVGDWSVDAAVLQAISRATQDFVSGYVDADRILAALATGLVDPFGESGPAGDALVEAAQVAGRARAAIGRTRSADVRASRDLAQWHGGPVTLGLGAELRNERLDDRTTALENRGVGIGAYPVSMAGHRDTQAAYAELELPLRPGVDAQLALRAEHYSDFGTGYNPKAALRWRAAPSLLWRASAGTGLRAPTLPELYSPPSPFEHPLPPDPIRCPVTQADADCKLEVPLIVGGNPALRPEHSTQASLGIVLEPVTGTTLSVDWWRLKLRNAIVELPVQLVLDGDPAFEGTNVHRGPPDAAFPNLPGPITGITDVNQNVNRQTASGIDLDLDSGSAATPLGRFSIALGGSWLADWSIASPGVGRTRSAGQYGYPRWRHTLTLGWEGGPWKATLVHTGIGSTVDAGPGPDGNIRHVAPVGLWDAQLAWTPSTRCELAFGVKNLADKAPPATNVDSFGIDTSLADPRVRVWYARIGLHAH